MQLLSSRGRVVAPGSHLLRFGLYAVYVTKGSAISCTSAQSQLVYGTVQ